MLAPIAFYIFIAGLTLLFCISVLLFLKRPFHLLATKAVSQVNTILDRQLTEKEKDRRILHNLKYLLGYLFWNLTALCLICVCTYIIYNQLINSSFLQPIDNESIFFYIAMTVGSLPLLFISSKKTDYNYWSRLLHELILDNYALNRYLHKKQKNQSVKSSGGKEYAEDFVVVSGFARAGTTALTTILYKSDYFHSTTYSDMPLLLAPHLWKKIRLKKKSKERERAHGDQLQFSEKSVEALEEYFFKVFLNDSYIKDDYLVSHSLREKEYEAYLSFQEAYRKSNKTRYLTKNNNFILRYSSVRQLNPDFFYLIMFRSPLEHAHSLLKQHRNFTQLQDKDPFVLKYMNWLGHHEFGHGLKLFYFDTKPSLEYKDNTSINFWLVSWINYYEHILSFKKHPNNIFIAYQDLLNHPNQLLASISERIGFTFKEKVEQFLPKKNSSLSSLQVNSEVLARANEIYKKLLNRSIK